MITSKALLLAFLQGRFLSVFGRKNMFVCLSYPNFFMFYSWKTCPFSWKMFMENSLSCHFLPFFMENCPEWMNEWKETNIRKKPTKKTHDCGRPSTTGGCLITLTNQVARPHKKANLEGAFNPSVSYLPKFKGQSMDFSGPCKGWDR